MFDKANSFWRGMTTAMTVNVRGKEIPLNPMYYFRNFANNKMSNVLFGGMNPTLVPERTIQGAKVMNYINSGKGGEQFIGDYKISDIAERYIRNGGLGGTNIDDIRKSLELDRTLGTVMSKIEGRGDLARNLENMDKMALFIDQKLKNVDDIAAMNKVRFALFDYAQLTDVEKTVIKPFFAFWTWNKKNFVSFFATLAKDPKRVKVFDDIFKGFGQLADEYDADIKEIIPDYLQGAYAVITNQKNQLSAIYGFGTNVEAVGDIIGRDYKETMSGGLSALAPAQRIMLETAVDYNFFKQKPISEDTSAYALLMIVVKRLPFIK